MELKKELTNKEISYLEKVIFDHFKNNARFDRHDCLVMEKTTNQLNDFLGLAYTSTSSFAMLSICNTEVYLDCEKLYNYVCFGMTKQGFIVALCYDKDEKELYIYLR